MNRRALHLASFLLLLSTLGMAESAATRGDQSLGAHYISVLLAQHEAAALAQTTDRSSESLATAELPATSLAQANIAWTMRPAAAHTAALHAVTGSSL